MSKPPDLVVKSFYVRRETKRGTKVTYKQVSRKYHVRSAAEDFKRLAQQNEPDATFYVHEVIGVEPG